MLFEKNIRIILKQNIKNIIINNITIKKRDIFRVVGKRKD